jgi:hypothetical protein
MWNVRAKVIPVIIWATETFQNYSDCTCATYRESMKLKNYKHSLIGHCTHTVECESKSDTGNNMATGTIPELLIQYLSNIPGKHEIKELQTQPYWTLHTYCGM